MREFLQSNESKRFGYHGWALQHVGSTIPVRWSTCTTRAEVRQLLTENRMWLDGKFKIVKVTIHVNAVGTKGVT